MINSEFWKNNVAHIQGSIDVRTKIISDEAFANQVLSLYKQYMNDPQQFLAHLHKLYGNNPL